VYKQFFSDKYEEDKETMKLIEAIENRNTDVQGTIFYKFPTIKEFDKTAVQPDVLIVSEKHGVLIIVSDSMKTRRDDEWRVFLEKKDTIDNNIYTTQTSHINFSYAP